MTTSPHFCGGPRQGGPRQGDPRQGGPRQGRTLARRLASRVRQGAAALRCRLPAPCPLCLAGARGGALCPPCQNDLRATSSLVRCPRCALRLDGHAACPDCAVRMPAFTYAITAFDYSPPADALILQLKQSLRVSRAGMLGGLLAEAVRRDPRGLPPGAILVPIPSSPPALRRRGFNPAAEIARAAAGSLDLEVCVDVLASRGANLAPQRTLARQARLAQAAERFELRGPAPRRTLAVVDDVMTTGATLHAAAQLLCDAGAAAVVALAVARTPYGRLPS